MEAYNLCKNKFYQDRRKVCPEIEQIIEVEVFENDNQFHLLLVDGCSFEEGFGPIFRPALRVLRHCVFRPAFGWLIILWYILS